MMNMIFKKQQSGIARLPGACSMALCVVLLPLSLWAQSITVSGTVTDESNKPAMGATVSVKGATTGVLTDRNGNYSINAPADATLVFSLTGFANKEDTVNGRTRINVALTLSGQLLNEVVVVGYGTQRKVTLTGAVAGVSGSEVIVTKNENVQNMLTGKIAGVRVWQKSAEPGVFNNAFDIRGLGSPLVVIDGVPRTMGDFQRLNPNDIDDISVLKDASAAIYGVRAANGVLLVTTKKGTAEGKAKLSYTGSFTLQQPSGMPKLADAFETMTIYNERTMNNVNGGNIVYTPEIFEEYRNGTRPTTDWNSLVFSSFSPQTQHDVSISGGNERAQYYVSMGYFFQEGFFKSGDLNYNKTNLRSNISIRIAKGLTFDLNLSGVLDQRNTPYSDAAFLIRAYWRQGVLYPAYADPEQTMLNYEGLEMDENTVAMMTSDVSGFRQYNQKYLQSSTSLNYDFGTITPFLKGLSAKALFSYDYRMDDNKAFRKEYYQYSYGSFAQKLYSPSSPNRIRREFYSKRQVLGQFLLNYDRAFGDHKVNGVLGRETQKREGDNFYAQRDLAYASPYLLAGVDEGQVGSMSGSNSDFYEWAYSAWIGRLNYTYADRYIAEVQFRYDGSSKFAAGRHWGFFPSASAAWRISEEPFFKSISALSFIDQLKIRASYGVLGDDVGGEDFDWVRGYIYPDSGGNADLGYYNQHVPGFIFDGNFVYGVAAKAIPNEFITWYTSRTFDIGVDFEAWNGLFGFSFDYFDRRREGRFARNTGKLPTVIGATAPQENLNSDRYFGIDLELTHRNKIGDLTYRVKAIGAITRQMYLHAAENGPWGNSYDQWRNDNLNNRYQGIQFGYTGAGRYTSWEDIWSYPVYKDRGVLPGDYKYEDWNGDGEINGLDEHPFAFDQTPWLNFSLNLDLAYKSFDLNLLFQGSALGSMQYREPLYAIWGGNGGGTLEQYLDRWHPVDPLADPYDPYTEWVSGYYGYTGHYPAGNSTFNRVSTAYLRLKSIELGYTLPKIKALSTVNLRVFVNAYNLMTLTGVKFVDPEHPDAENGRLYPLNKTYSVGLNLSF
ncbi:MAG: TonB-dependent receptor [Prevotellaceae bacterium]|jgi:TonB-linked SusC/RagA family outer membrane protein|nr:TonB-dependent receptor [Prevotellaceae bacterium]